MIVYKFRTFRNIEHLFDILKHRRFYAAGFTELNDPLEGTFRISPNMQHALDRIKDEKNRINICSFSKKYSNPLLWAHYADSFRGICFEVEVDTTLPGLDWCDVSYSKHLPWIDDNNLFSEEISQMARKVLSSKIKNWKYEEEVRVFTEEKFLSNIAIKSILLGTRISEHAKWLFHELPLDGIEVYATRIDNTIIKKAENIKALPNLSMRRRSNEF